MLLSLRARLEYLLSPHQTLATARISGSLGNLLSIHQRNVAGLQIAAPQGTDTDAHQLLNAQT